MTSMTEVRAALAEFIEEQMSCVVDFRSSATTAMDHILNREIDDAQACLEELCTSLYAHENTLSEMAREENW